MLRDALAVFVCTVDEMMVAHSHAVIIGEFKAVLLSPRSDEPRMCADGLLTTLLKAGVMVTG